MGVLGRTIIGVAFMALSTPCAIAQGRPDLSGEWVRVEPDAGARTVATRGDASFRTGDMGSGWSGALTIRQTADSIEIRVAHFSTYDLQPRLKYVWRLDGSESRLDLIVGHASVQAVSRARWEGARLSVESRFPVPDGVRPESGELRQFLSLGDDGALNVEAIRAGAARPDTVRTVYRRPQRP